jgi:biopolymer transport protein ExbD
MGRKSKAPSIPDEMKGDMTPMIDVVFQLLIFFMLTIKFKTLEGKLSAYLPKDVGVNTTPSVPKEKIEIKLKVEKEGTKLDPREDLPWSGTGPFRYGPDRIVKYSIGPKSTTNIKEAYSRLRELFLADPEQPATIDPYPGTVYADVVLILDEVLKVGYRDISFVGDRSATAGAKK